MKPKSYLIIDILPTVEVIMVVVVVLVVVAVLVVVVLVLVVVVVVLVVAVVTEFIVAEIVEVAVVVVEIIVAMFVVNTGLFSLVVVSLVELQACTIGAVVNVKAMRSTIPLLDIIILNDALVTNTMKINHLTVVPSLKLRVYIIKNQPKM